MECEVIMKDVLGFEGEYAATEDGRVWSHKTNTYLSQSVNARGYVRVKVGQKTMYVHRLVALAFLPNPENKPTVNHINGVKTDNRLENLEWATHLEQVTHAYDTGLREDRFGEDTGNNKLTSEQVVQLRKEYVELGLTQDTLAEKYNVTRSAISLALRGDNWKHLPGSEGIKEISKNRAAESTRKYDPSFVRELRLKHRAGYSIKGLSREYGIPYVTVNYIVNFKTYADFDKDLQEG